MDEISTAFSTLRPEDLIRETSAIDDSVLVLEDAVGEDAFTEWIKGMQSLTWRRGVAGDFQAFAVLGKRDRRRIFAAEGDETPELWAARLHREAVQLQATWFFLAMLAPGRSYLDGEEPEDIERTAEAIDAAIDNGKLTVSICWFAIRNDEQGRSNMAGLIHLNEEGKPQSTTIGLLDEDNTFFRVLENDHAV